MISLYDISIGTYKRVLTSTINVLDKGLEHASHSKLDLNKVIEMRLIDDMAPFTFQINSVRHHSLGAIEGIKKGEFSPPPKLPELDYQGLQNFLKDALTELETVKPDEINSLFGKPMYFRSGNLEIPFATENFITSFSLPNLYFHATTIYDMLRIQGVALSKGDFLKSMNIGLPNQ